MFHVPSDTIADKSFSLNLIQLDHPHPVPPSPEISPSSSPASLSCSSIASLKPWRSTSESFSFPVPIYRNVEAVTTRSSHEHSGQHMSALDMPSSQEPTIPSVEEDERYLRWTTSVPYNMTDVFFADAQDLPPLHPSLDCPTNPNSSHCKIGGLHHTVSTGALDMPSSQEPTISSVDDELDDLHWTTGVPCHMMDVFRADPFAAIDPPPTSTIHPSLDCPINPNSGHCKVGGLHHTRSTTKHVLSPDAVEQKRKTRRKRARVQFPAVVPFPSTGPQEMFAYEFMLEIPYKSITVSPREEHRRHGELPASYSSPRAMDDHAHLHMPRPVIAYGSEDASMRSPFEQDMELFLPPRLPYPYSLTASIPPKTRPEYHMQPSHYPPFHIPFSTHMSLRLPDPSSSTTTVSRQGIDEHQLQFDKPGSCTLPHDVSMQDAQERARDYRLSAVSTVSLVQKPLYACPLCPRDFQLPNGLALHLKWHDRVGNITQNPNHCLSRRAPPMQINTESGPLDTCGVRLAQIPAQDNGQRGTISRLSTIPYVGPRLEANFAQTESITSSSHEQYTRSALSYERQPQECALFHDALQINHNMDNDTYLAPLDDLSVLQPLPSEQCHSTTGHLRAISPP